MGIFVILILGLACVKSDVGVGYQYKVPATSYDVPFGSIGSLTNDRKYYHVGKQGLPSSVVPISPSSQLQTPVHEHTSFVGGHNFGPAVSFSPADQHSTNLLNNLRSTDNRGGTPSLSVLGTNLNNYGGAHNVALDSKSSFESGKSHSVLSDSKSSFGGHNAQNVVLDSKSNFHDSHSQQVEVQKHLYFYSAPEEPEDVRPRIIAPPPAAKKNVKILFIKAPTFNSGPIHVPALPQQQEKTLVYVLVKKPEETSIVLPTPSPAKPSKPEVYFIRYKTQKEAEEAVSNLQQGTASGGIAAIDSNEFNASPFSNNVLPTGHHFESQPSVDYNQNINLVSKISSSVNENEGLVAQTPVLPTASSGESTLHIDSGHSRLSNIVTPEFPLSTTQTDGAKGFSSDAITSFDGSLSNRGKEFEAPATSSLPTSPTRFSGEVNVHQVYGPPSN